MRLSAFNRGAVPVRGALMTASAALIALSLAGCADDDTTGGTPFTQALAKDYTDLSTQAAALPVPNQDTGFFAGLFGGSNPNDALVESFDTKAETATSGQEPVPEPAL